MKVFFLARLGSEIEELFPCPWPDEKAGTVMPATAGPTALPGIWVGMTGSDRGKWIKRDCCR